MCTYFPVVREYGIHGMHPFLCGIQWCPLLQSCILREIQTYSRVRVFTKSACFLFPYQPCPTLLRLASVLLLIDEVFQSQLPLHLSETSACPPIYSSLTNFVVFPIIFVLFLSSSVRQSKMFSWVYLHSSLAMCSGSFTQWKPICA